MTSILTIVKEQLILKRMNTVQGWLILSSLSILIAWIIARLNYPDAFMVPALIAGAGLLFFILLKPEAGFYFTILFSFLHTFILFILLRAYTIKPGFAIDLSIWVTTFSILINKARKRDSTWNYYGSSTSLSLVIYLIFILIEVFNPEKPTFTGWIAEFRREISIFFLFYISLELFSGLQFFRNFIRLWLIIATFAAFYGCFQQVHGFLPSEQTFIFSSQQTFLLIFVDGHFRKFSIFPDPTSFGLFMGFSSVFFIGLLSGPAPVRLKFIYAGCSMLMIAGMLFSGTRTAYAMLPVGFLLFSVMTLDRRVSLYIILSGVLVLLFILFAPVYNPTMERLRSLFTGSSDPSMNIRNVHRKMIQPFMHRHPMGEGIATVGTMGTLYNPGGPLAGFPPDSELLGKGLEIGYLGLLIYMSTLFFPIVAGIRGYFAARNPEVKTYLISLVAMMVSIVLSLYSQEISLYTTLFLAILSAFIIKLNSFDEGMI